MLGPHHVLRDGERWRVVNEQHRVRHDEHDHRGAERALIEAEQKARRSPARGRSPAATRTQRLSKRPAQSHTEAAQQQARGHGDSGHEPQHAARFGEP